MTNPSSRLACCLFILLAAVPLSAQTSVAAKKKAPAKDSPCAVCGTERWDIKTLSDGSAAQVNFTAKNSTVKELFNLPAPATGAKRNPAEKQTYTVHAKLIGYKIEFNPELAKPGDHDFHIVLQDLNGPETMVVEIPDIACSGACSSVKKDAIAQARGDFLNGVTTPPTSRFFTLKQPVEVTVTGVGFFDFEHGQTGLAKNCVELHPVLDFQFPSGKVSGESEPSLEPKEHPKSFYHCMPEQHVPAKKKAE